jgi:hypothetical protein
MPDQPADRKNESPKTFRLNKKERALKTTACKMVIAILNVEKQAIEAELRLLKNKQSSPEERRAARIRTLEQSIRAKDEEMEAWMPYIEELAKRKDELGEDARQAMEVVIRNREEARRSRPET